MHLIKIVDSHTGGEPTRVVVSGGPDLGGGPLARRKEIFQRDHDHYRSAVVNEPRGSDVMVGALLVEPSDKSCACGVIFFNNVGCLAMCGHGTIGLVVTLAHLGKIKAGEHKIETPVGIVTATLHANGEVSVANVPSYRKQKIRFRGRSRHRQNFRRCRVGRQLVFSRERTRPRTHAGECRSRSPI
jgi:4-hydroxyproline epimerase